MGKHIKFTEEQKQFMIDNYKEMSNQSICDYFNDESINKHKIEYWLKNNGYLRGKGSIKRIVFSDLDKEYMTSHYLDMEYSEIGKIINKTERQVRGWLNNNGYTKNRKVNSDYFKNIDNELKAYFLGYIFADGYIIYNVKNRNYEFGMELQSGDDYVLTKLNEMLGNMNIIYKSEPSKQIICGKEVNRGCMSCLRVYSKQLVENLINNGIETNKSQKDIYPIVDNNLFFDWLRGYIDGDGCFWKYKNNYYMHITCASEIVLKYIQNKLFEFNIETRIYKEHDKKYRLMCVNIEEMKKLVSRLYYKDGLFYLTRKYEKVKYYLGFAA